MGLMLSTGGMVAWLNYASYMEWKGNPSPEPVFRS